MIFLLIAVGGAWVILALVPCGGEDEEEGEGTGEMFLLGEEADHER